MANGDELVVGELGNAATSTTRLVGDVDANAVLWIEQQSETKAGEAIVALGGPGRTAIFGFGGNSNTGRGGLAIAGQGGNGVPHDLGGIGVLGSGGGPSDNRAATAYGGLRDHRARLAYSGSISVSGPVCEVMVAVPTAGQRAQPTGNGVGVEGRSGGGKGVHGAASASPGIGVFAEHTGSGRALAVTGRAGFSSCGSGTIAAGQASRTVSNPAVTAESHITVTLTANPGASARIHWVARQAGSFTVHLTQRVSSSTSFTYLIVEPFSGQIAQLTQCWS